MIENTLFYCKNKHTYPPFKNGLYLEEYFLENFIKNAPTSLKRKYIPAFWTNFQIEDWFHERKEEMQNALNMWIANNPLGEKEDGYFTVVQHDDGPKLELPQNTIVYGACCGNVPIPLIYQDTNNTLLKMNKKTFHEKEILCSFVGNNTNYVRRIVLNMFSGKQNNFKIINSGGWNPEVNQDLQDIFTETTINSKFALAPRGYGRSSFRFFECFLLGTIPVYVWDDVEWLPFKNLIDYTQMCVSIHVHDLEDLEQKLLSIDEYQYTNMWNYYNEVKHLFELKGMADEILQLHKMTT
jgi:hypothetical protein